MMAPMMMLKRTPLLSPPLQRQLNEELRAGEKVVWAAQPLPRLYGRQALGAVVFGIPWTAFAIFWTIGFARQQANAPGESQWPTLFGVPFVLIGLAMLSSPFWMHRAALRTIYAVTNERAIVMQGKSLGGVEVQSFTADRLLSITRTQRADGSGDLVFEQFRQQQGSGTTTIRRGFLAVADVRDVEDVIRTTLVRDRVRTLDVE